ncbi:MAG: TonB-dependent receptor, partial [Rhodothermia bacterium]
RLAIGCSGVVLVALCGGPAFSQQVDTLRLVKIGDTYRPIDDSTTIYHLGAVVVGSRVQRIQTANTFQQITLNSIDNLDAVKVSEFGPLIPSGFVQTNSRGESLLYLRNSGERQVALFFDGALLNIPWDNRIDLDLIPASALSSLSISKGAASAAYGANVMGGAVSMTTRSLGKPGRFTEFDFQAGNAGRFEGEAVQLGRSDSFQYLASVGYYSQAGIPLSGKVDLPYGQSDPDIRTNTDMKRFNAFGRGAFSLENGTQLALSASYIDAEKGIAPEGHKQPGTPTIRYWRYPDWRNLMLIASIGSELESDRNTGYRGAVWMNRFEQGIVSFESEKYETPNARQDDDDVTLGGRFVFRNRIGASEARFSLNGSHSRHRQVERVGESGSDQTFRQILGSAGIEADIRPGGPVWYSASLNLDLQAIPDADVFEAPDPEVEFGGMLGAVYPATSEWTVRVSGGRKSRFPTMRERYAEGLGRFIVNPDLVSEQAFLGEAGVKFVRLASHIELVAFTNLTSNTIDQDVIQVGGEAKRIRVNLGGSRSFGLELDAATRPIQGLLLQANGMINYLRAQDGETGAYDRRLTERPNTLASITGTYNHRSGLTGMFSLVHTGSAFSLGDSGEFLPLAPSTVLNGRAGYRFHLRQSPRAIVELFGRVNNAFDVLVENQLGLPGPGRAVLAGVKMGL